MEEIEKLVKEAEESIKQRKFSDAGRYSERAAAIADDKKETVALLKKAAEAFRESRSTHDEIRCYLNAGRLSEGKEKAESLLSCWRAYIQRIVDYEYDCSFEWRGETDGSHDSYLNDLDRYQKEAENVLTQALTVKKVKKKKIIKQAADECRRREQTGGWGASRCWKTIENAEKNS